MSAALQDIEFKEPNNSYEIGDIIKLQSLGVESKIEKASNFTYNIKTNWEIAEIKLLMKNRENIHFLPMMSNI